jgi:hypothetical protein
VACIGIPGGSICGAIAIKELIECIGRQRDVATIFLLVVYITQSERARSWYLDEAAFHICINRAAACVFTITKFFHYLDIRRCRSGYNKLGNLISRGFVLHLQ